MLRELDSQEGKALRQRYVCVPVVQAPFLHSMCVRAFFRIHQQKQTPEHHLSRGRLWLEDRHRHCQASCGETWQSSAKETGEVRERHCWQRHEVLHEARVWGSHDQVHLWHFQINVPGLRTGRLLLMPWGVAWVLQLVRGLLQWESRRAARRACDLVQGVSHQDLQNVRVSAHDVLRVRLLILLWLPQRLPVLHLPFQPGRRQLLLVLPVHLAVHPCHVLALRVDLCSAVGMRDDDHWRSFEWLQWR